METMDNSLIILVSLFTIGLVALNILSYYSERTMVLPSVIWTLGLGIIYGAITRFTSLDIPLLVLDPHVIFFTLVPILIFAASKNMCLYHFRKVLKKSSVLATVGIVISASVVMGLLHFLLNIPLVEAFLFGVIISATDPIAVGAILHNSSNISNEKKMLVEGESILNDGFVVALFATLSILVFQSSKINYFEQSTSLVINIFLALILGFMLGKAARVILRLWSTESVLFPVNITIALAFSSFLLAEKFHLPGVLAIFAAALTFAYKPDHHLDKTQTSQHTIWQYLEYLANQILFFFLGASFFQQVSLDIMNVSIIILSIVVLFFKIYGSGDTLAITEN